MIRLTKPILTGSLILAIALLILCAPETRFKRTFGPKAGPDRRASPRHCDQICEKTKSQSCSW